MCLYQLISFSKHQCNYCLMRSSSYLQSACELPHAGDITMSFSHTACAANRYGVHSADNREAALALIGNDWWRWGGKRLSSGQKRRGSGMKVGNRCSAVLLLGLSTMKGLFKVSLFPHAHFLAWAKTQCHHTTDTHTHSSLRAKHVISLICFTAKHHSESAGICSSEQLLVTPTAKEDSRRYLMQLLVNRV